MENDRPVHRMPDTFRITTREKAEVDYWTRRFGVSREELLSAVRAVGDREENVRRHLGK